MEPIWNPYGTTNNHKCQMSYIMNCTKVPISKHKAFDFPLTLLLHSLKGDLITGSQRVWWHRLAVPVWWSE